MPTKTIAFPSQRSPSYNSTFQTSPWDELWTGKNIIYNK
jgi:hypothetical protein